MQAEEYRDLLKKYDDPKHVEFPEGFDHRRAEARFRGFVADLEAALGSSVTCETGALIQDASFHSQVLFNGALLRFSNFGDMAALLDEEGRLAGPVVETIERLLNAHGYVYIPTSILWETYTGRAAAAIPDWWIRYFDWL